MLELILKIFFVVVFSNPFRWGYNWRQGGSTALSALHGLHPGARRRKYETRVWRVCDCRSVGDDGSPLYANRVRTPSFTIWKPFCRLLNSVILSWFFHRPNGRKVVLGVHSLSEPEETKQTFDILELYNHPDYSARNYDNDIALIKVCVYFTVLGSKTTTDWRVKQNNHFWNNSLYDFCSWIVRSTRLMRSERWNICEQAAQTPTRMQRLKQLAGGPLIILGPDQTSSKRLSWRCSATGDADAVTTLAKSWPLTCYVRIKFAQIPVINPTIKKTAVM